MKYRIREAEAEEARAIWAMTAPDDVWDCEDDDHWCAYDERGDAVAFASSRFIDDYVTMYLTAAGVLPEARGQKLQRRLIRVRSQYARRMGAKHIVTYTVLHNYPSILNLLKEGFKFHEPQFKWAGSNVHYFLKNL